MRAPIDQRTAVTPATIAAVRYSVFQGHCAIVQDAEAVPTEPSAALSTPPARSDSFMMHRSARLQRGGGVTIIRGARAHATVDARDKRPEVLILLTFRH